MKVRLRDSKGRVAGSVGQHKSPRVMIQFDDEMFSLLRAQARLQSVLLMPWYESFGNRYGDF